MSDITLLDMMNRCIDDQMVPEVTQCNTVDSSGGFTSYANQTLPDLELLLEDLSNTTELQQSSASVATSTSITDISSQLVQVPPQQQQQRPMEALKHEWKTFDLDPYNDTSLYDDTPQAGALKAEKVFIKAEEVGNTDCYYTQQAPSTEQQQQQQPPADDPMLEDLCSRICCTCNVLGIPTDPYSWTPQHVDRWLQHTLQQYNLSDQYCQQLTIDGTTLCMLTPEDFRRFSPVAAEFIQTELDIWKTAHNLISTSQASRTASPSESTVLTDLDSLTSTYYQPTSASGIPTSVITYTTTPMREVPLETASPNQVLCQQQQQLRISPAPSLESQSSGSPHATWTSSPDSSRDMDDKDLTVSYPQERPLITSSHSKHTIHLWQFLKELLYQPHHYQDCIRWMDRSKGIFKIEDSCRVARLWGQRKNRPAMNYDKLSRSIRQYYKKGIIKKTTTSKRLVYQFQPQYLF